MPITVKFEGGPMDGVIQKLDKDYLEYRFLESKPMLTIQEEIAPKYIPPPVEHIYKKSAEDPHIFWYAGSVDGY